jgi:hypothetical protein
MALKEIPNPLTEDLVPLDSQVKITEEPLPSVGSHSWVICGRKGTGKSSLLLRALTSKKSPWCCSKSFDNVFLCSQSAGKDDKFAEMVEELAEEGHFHSTFNEKILEDIEEEIKAYNKQYKDDMAEYKSNKEITGKGFYTRNMGRGKDGREIIKKFHKERQLPRHLIILDDCINLLPRSTANSRINDLYTNHRHLKASIITTSQVYNKLSTAIRRNADMLSLFRTENAQEYDAISGDWCIDPKTFDKVWDFATAEPHSFLHVQVCGPRPIFFKKFNRIMMDDIPH